MSIKTSILANTLELGQRIVEGVNKTSNVNIAANDKHLVLEILAAKLKTRLELAKVGK